jgi:hypothetical protein
MIASRVIRLTAGCVSKCNELERCLEEPCDIKIVPNPTTTSTSTLPITTTTTSTTAVPTTTTTSSSSTSTTTSTSSSTSTTTSSSSTSTTTSTSSSTTSTTTTQSSISWTAGFANTGPSAGWLWNACNDPDMTITIYTANNTTPFAPNTAIYTDPGLTTLLYPSSIVAISVLGVAYEVINGYTNPLGGTGQNCEFITTTSTTTTLAPTTTTTTTEGPLRYFYNATFYNCGDCVTPSGAGSFNNSQPLTAGMYYINSSGIIIYINSFNSVVPGISVNNILDSSQQVNCGDIVCPTTTTTTTVEPTTTTTTSTSSTSSTTTTTTTLILSACTVFINNFSVTGNILAYDPVTNQSNELTTLPFSQDIATTANKLWIYDTFTAQIAEYNITLSPWSINFNRYINYPSGIYLGNGLGSIDDTTLITVDNSFNDIMKLDISGSTAVVTDIFGTLDAGYSVSGDILYTTTGKIICTVNSFDNTVLKLVQYDAVTGTKEVEVDLTYLLPAIALGVFEHLGKLYLATQAFKIYEVDLISPYTITLVNTITFGVSGASSAPSCSTVNLIPPA